jgi:hypothetical protein
MGSRNNAIPDRLVMKRVLEPRQQLLPHSRRDENSLRKERIPYGHIQLFTEDVCVQKQDCVW